MLLKLRNNLRNSGEYDNIHKHNEIKQGKDFVNESSVFLLFATYLA